MLQYFYLEPRHSDANILYLCFGKAATFMMQKHCLWPQRHEKVSVFLSTTITKQYYWLGGGVLSLGEK